jgi:hypothetical protein
LIIDFIGISIFFWYIHIFLVLLKQNSNSINFIEFNLHDNESEIDF